MNIFRSFRPTIEKIKKKLYNAIRHNNYTEVETILQNYPDIISSERDFLHDAIFYEYTDIAKLLIDNGVYVNSQDSYGYTPLHIACMYNSYEGSKFLLENGADPNIVNFENKTPFQLARMFGNIELLNYLSINFGVGLSKPKYIDTTTEELCEICFENKGSIQLECNHIFCKDCIENWTRTKENMGLLRTCPKCRANYFGIKRRKRSKKKN